MRPPRGRGGRRFKSCLDVAVALRLVHLNEAPPRSAFNDALTILAALAQLGLELLIALTPLQRVGLQPRYRIGQYIVRAPLREAPSTLTLKRLTGWTTSRPKSPAHHILSGKSLLSATTKELLMAAHRDMPIRNYKPRTQMVMRTVLFLCTGNYYRSRFAEELFNHRAARGGLSWVAQSRALAIERGINNVGALSPFALKALAERGLVAQAERRMPQQCSIIDLQTANHIVALNEEEHHPLMLERFPYWKDRAEYWTISDIDVAPPQVALSAIDSQIDELVGRLATAQSAAR